MRPRAKGEEEELRRERRYTYDSFAKERWQGRTLIDMCVLRFLGGCVELMELHAQVCRV